MKFIFTTENAEITEKNKMTMRTLQAVRQMINHIEKVLIYSLLSDG